MMMGWTSFPCTRCDEVLSVPLTFMSPSWEGLVTLRISDAGIRAIALHASQHVHPRIKPNRRRVGWRHR